MLQVWNLQYPLEQIKKYKISWLSRKRIYQAVRYCLIDFIVSSQEPQELIGFTREDDAKPDLSHPY